MNRIAHYIKPNARNAIPHNLLFIDTEAMISHRKEGIQAQTFRLGYGIHVMRKNGEWSPTPYPFNTIDDCWELLDRIAYRKTRLWVVAHNMAYDYAILKLDTYLSSRNIEITVRVLDSIFMIRAGNLIFISSTNFYRQSLKSLGEIFGLSKFDTPDFESCSDSVLMEYCKRDTEVLAHIMLSHIEFLFQNDLGCVKPTLAGQAFTTFRHRFMKHRLLVHTYPEILALEKESYRGGRCEAFKLGRHSDITSVDINSMYPFVMQKYSYPIAPTVDEPMLNPPLDSISEALDLGLHIVADCNVNLKMPLIAVRRKKLLFPVGKVRQTIISPEIEYLLAHPECGNIEKVHRMVTYERAPIFRDYVKHFYEFRKSTDNPAYKEMAKLLLNALYGKFGQHASHGLEPVIDNQMIATYFQMMDASGTFEIITSPGKKYVRIGDKLYRSIKTSSSEFSANAIPVIASAVTAYARVYLFSLMRLAKLENVLYCDTDSMFLTLDGFKNIEHLISPDKLGFLKVERFGAVEIHGAKDYTFNLVTKLKGIKHDAIMLPDGTYRQMQFATKNLRYRNGTPDGTVIVAPVIKSLSRVYDKGLVSGTEVRPFTFADY